MSGRGAGATAEPRQQRKMIKMCTDMTPAMTQKMMQHGATMQAITACPARNRYRPDSQAGPAPGGGQLIHVN
jgi:hypothetical protein